MSVYKVHHNIKSNAKLKLNSINDSRKSGGTELHTMHVNSFDL